MNRARFLEERRPAWKRLEELLRAARGPRGRLRGEEVSELGRLFREACYDLSLVRSREWGSEIEDELNGLVRRGHDVVYRSPPAAQGSLLRFFAIDFPRTLREQAGYFWTALALFVVPGIAAGVTVWKYPDSAVRLLPADMLEQFDQMYPELPQGRDSTGTDAAMTGFYIWNNVGIALRCFATGIVLGVGPIFFLVQNSIVFGVVAAHLMKLGRAESFFSFVVGHAAFELTAIVIAGAGGLILGHAILHPGNYSRLGSLRVRGLEAVRLAGGAAGMLAIAALIEGFWSPSMAPVEWKFIVGALLWSAVIVWLVFAGKGGRAG